MVGVKERERRAENHHGADGCRQSHRRSRPPHLQNAEHKRRHKRDTDRQYGEIGDEPVVFAVPALISVNGVDDVRSAPDRRQTCEPSDCDDRVFGQEESFDLGSHGSILLHAGTPRLGRNVEQAGEKTIKRRRLFCGPVHRVACVHQHLPHENRKGNCESQRNNRTDPPWRAYRA